MAWVLSRQAHANLTLYSRSLSSPEAVRLQLWPRFENPESKRLGRSFFKVQSRGDAHARWHEPKMRELLKPYGYTYESPEEQYSVERKANLVARGKNPTKKGEGKKKSRRK